MRVLVTGGAGYIGAHVCVALQEQGHQVVVIDNLCNGDPDAMAGIAAITGKRPVFVHGDVRDRALLDQLLSTHRIDAVLHFAALKDVAASCQQPQLYLEHNAGGMQCLLQAMAQAGVTRLVFSSSAAVYGDSASSPIPESAPLQANSPYGQSKILCEDLVRAHSREQSAFRAAVLRYFNPLGAHPSGHIGELVQAQNSGLLAQIMRAANGQQAALTVYGTDYPTGDGTGIRDYVHVWDIARAHVQALAHLHTTAAGITLNLGTGAGCSVLELVQAFEQVSGCPVPLQFSARRSGDVAISYADPTQAQHQLGWQAKLGIQRMCEDAWRRQRTRQNA